MSSESINPTPHDDSAEESRNLTIRVPRGRVSGLKRRHIRLAAALLAAVVAAALIVGLGIDFHPRASQERKIDLPPENAQPSPIADLPSSYADVASAKPKSAASTDLDRQNPYQGSMQPSPREQALQQALARLAESIQKVGQENKQLAQQIAAYQSAAGQQQAKVWASGLFFKLDDTAAQQAQAPANPAQMVAAGEPGADRNANAFEREIQSQGERLEALLPQAPGPQPQSDQERKLAFLNGPSSPGSEPPRPVLQEPPDEKSGVYQLQAGTVIPAALLTGINTDLPGDVVATVTSPVYDSATGNHLLIPQGARLYGSYDSQISMAQDRALLVWHQLLFPDGASVNLDRMRGTDGGGYAGIADQVDYHSDKLAAAAVLSGIVAYAGNLARNPQEDVNNSSGDVVGDAVAQQASAIGSKIIDRQLNVQPTITVRPGWPVRVLVNRDFDLPPYAE